MTTREKEPFKIAASDYANMSCWLKILVDCIHKIASNRFPYGFVSIESSESDIVTKHLSDFTSKKYDECLHHKITIWVDVNRAKELQVCLRHALDEACKTSWPFGIGPADKDQVDLFYYNKNIITSMTNPGIHCSAAISPLPKMKNGCGENAMITIITKCEVPLELHEVSFFDRLKKFFKRKKKS